ncbi:hypothetical protein [Litchfieldia alkalitelluris]|nr:hypothetical protein [Litchfieldia alkalitelluris]
MKQNKKAPQKLSYESDEKMGKEQNRIEENKKEQAEFFNTTQNSE